MSALLILGNQLFPIKSVKALADKNGVTQVFMREDRELCTYYKFHKHKIILFLSAMRTYAEELRAAGLRVHYEPLQDEVPFEKRLADFLSKNGFKKLYGFEIEDKFFETRIAHCLEKEKVEWHPWPSMMFLTSRLEFKEYLGKYKKPFMKHFYEGQRKRLKILLDKDGAPLGGRWSFDTENRKPLPAKAKTPGLCFPEPTTIVRDVQKLCDQEFADHPGDSARFWLPVSRDGAIAWFKEFVKERLSTFGPFEDAIPTHSDFVYHSVLTPFLNTGLLTPAEVLRYTVAAFEKKNLPIESVEGFVRQIIGWREFIRGIYQNFSEKEETTNYWKHKRKLTEKWYTAETGIPPLDHAIEKINRYAYAHHIERLMVIGSLMVLLEVEPSEAHRWFMEMFIDSSDWVMGPNVYGMALFSDGGIFATKPYICGSNYYRKMGPYKKEAWCDGVDGLYWQFVEKHLDFFSKNPRLSMISKTVQKMDPERKKDIYQAANELRKQLVL